MALCLMIGRIGAMAGNVVFPVLFQAGCWEPFVMLGLLILISVVLGFLLPKTETKALE